MDLIKKIFSHPTPAKTVNLFAWADKLDDLDDISCIAHVAEQLTEELREQLAQHPAQIERFIAIDEQTQIVVERITTHYVAIENIGASLRDRILNAVYLYHRQLFLAYLHLLEECTISNQRTLHLFLSRALRNASQMIKWRYFNFQSAPANVWLQLASLYQIAEEKALLNAKFQAYIGLDPISLSTAYIHACMLGTLETLSLECPQIELASKALLAWCSKTSIDKVYDEKQHLFYIDTATNAPARRIRNLNHADTFRYWSFNTINARIELCISLIELNITPKQASMEAFVHHKHALSTFKTLHNEWSSKDYKRQRRAEKRIQDIQAVSVAYGFKAVCNQMRLHESSKHSPTAHEPQVYNIDLSANYANLVDKSTTGVGLNTNKDPSEVHIGMLVSIYSDRHTFSTKLGIIRSIRPLANHELHIGVQLLSNAAYFVEAENISRHASSIRIKEGEFSISSSYFEVTNFNTTTGFIDSDFGTDPQHFSCLFLPKLVNSTMQETLIIPKLQYNKTDVFKAHILGENILIKFTKSFESHSNWVRVTFTSDINSKPQY